MQDGSVIAVVDLGGTNLRAAVVGSDGALLARIGLATNAREGRDGVLRDVVISLRRACERADVRPPDVAAVGISVAGAVDHETGHVHLAPNIPGWVDVPLKRLVEQELQRPTFVGNDANLAALAEHHYGAGQGVQDLIYITVSTGVGGGVIIGGRLHTGVSGSAGEIGHQTVDMHGPPCNCGNVGCVEALASGTAIARAASLGLSMGGDNGSSVLRQMDRNGPLSAKEVAWAAQAGDAYALRVFREAAKALGVGIVNLLHLFNPALIVIGGGVSKAGPLLFDPVAEVVQARAIRVARDAVRIVPAALADDVGLYGAAAWALAHVEMGHTFRA